MSTRLCLSSPLVAISLHACMCTVYMFTCAWAYAHEGPRLILRLFLDCSSTLLFWGRTSFLVSLGSLHWEPRLKLQVSHSHSNPAGICVSPRNLNSSLLICAPSASTTQPCLQLCLTVLSQCSMSTVPSGPYSVASPQLFLQPCSWSLQLSRALSHLSSWPSWCSRTLSKPFSGMWCHSLSLSLVPSLITATLCPATIQIVEHSSTSLTNLFLLSYSLCWTNCLLCGFNQMFPSTKLIWLNAPALCLHERDLESR